MIVPAQTGVSLQISKHCQFDIIDLFGQQVVDFFATNPRNHREFISPGVTMDINESLYLNEGDLLYSNLYNPMFKILKDEVGTHDLIHPSCRSEMYDYFYDNGPSHPSCYQNIFREMEKYGPWKPSIIRPINFFMNTQIDSNGNFTVLPPISHAGDKVTLECLMDAIIFLTPCSVSESQCNGGKCTSVEILIKNKEITECEKRTED